MDKTVKVTIEMSEPAYAKLVELAKMSDCDMTELLRRSFQFLEWGLTRSSEGWDMELRKDREVVEVELDMLQAVKPLPLPKRNLRLVFSKQEQIKVETENQPEKN